VQDARVGDDALEALAEFARPREQMADDIERVDGHPLGEVEAEIRVL
jgi:hypothetical protein